MEKLSRIGAEFEQALLLLDRVSAEKHIWSAIDTLSPIDAMEQVITPALERIGSRWQSGEVALAQVYMSGIICEEIVDMILPTKISAAKSAPRIAIAVLEDHHQLGKRIACSVLRSAGYDFVDYGHGVDAEKLVVQAVQDKVDILLISTLMLSSALRVKDVTAALQRQGARTKVIAGGAPFRLDPALALETGVDAVSFRASDLPAIIKKLEQ